MVYDSKMYNILTINLKILCQIKTLDLCLTKLFFPKCKQFLYQVDNCIHMVRRKKEKNVILSRYLMI
jgi:hypothetical protein